MGTVIAGAGLHRERLLQLLGTTIGSVRIATAYLTESTLLTDLGSRDVRLLTGLSAMDIVSGATSLKSLETLVRSGVQCRSLPAYPRFHPKVYIVGNDSAIVTSANFTTRALDSNIEVGVVLGGSDVRDLISWFDGLWGSAEPLDTPHLSSLREQTAEARQAFAQFRRKHRLLDQAGGLLETMGLSSQRQAVRSPRVFVCNSNRKELGEDGEYLMRSRGYAVAWEAFQSSRDMADVRSGDLVLLYANQVGIIGVGRALGPCEVLEPEDPRRVSGQFDTREWRIPVDWLRWVHEGDACPWKGVLPPTFHNVSGERWSGHREEVIRHFLGDWKSLDEQGE